MVLILGSPSFLQWASQARDPEPGSTVLEMLKALWEDPVGSSEQFATILRLYEFRAHLPPQRNVLAGKYEILRALGRGGNGDVFLVWSRETRCLYGLKVIRSALCHEPSVLNRFKKEVETWVNIGGHPNIVKANFLDVIGDALHMTMEYIEGDGACGPSLIDKLQNGAIDPNTVAAWFAQVADGLHHAYQRGVASHRDLKPGNILIARDGTAKVTDFGLVALLSNSQGAAASQHGATQATPCLVAYLAHRRTWRQNSSMTLASAINEAISIRWG